MEGILPTQLSLVTEDLFMSKCNGFFSVFIFIGLTLVFDIVDYIFFLNILSTLDFCDNILSFFLLLSDDASQFLWTAIHISIYECTL